MRTARRTSLALAVAVVGLSLAVAATPALAAGQVVTPSVGTTNAGTSFTLTGVQAEPTEAVTLKLAGHADIPGTVSNPGAGPLCQLKVSDSDCGTSITVAVDITNAFPGVYSVARTQTSPLSQTPVTSVQANAYTIKSQPVFVSLSPAVRGQDSSSPVTITGKGFGPNPQVTFGDGVLVSDITYVNATKITATVKVDPAAVLGTRNVSVTSADGLSFNATNAFTVGPAPTLTSITPAAATRGQALTGVVLTGTNLVTGGDFAVLINGVVTTNAVASNGGTTITANLTVDAAAAGGDRTVLLVNADGGRARILNGFHVTAPPDAPAAVAAVPGDGQVIVAWSPPASAGSSPVTGYTVTSTPATTPINVGPTLRQATVTGLANGTAYTFDVVATSADGVGAKATTVATTPKLVVGMSLTSSRTSAIASQSTVVSGNVVRASTGAAFASAPVTLKIATAFGSSTRPLLTDANGHWSSTVTLTYSTTFTISYAGSPSTSARSSSLAVPVATHVVVVSPRSGATTKVGTPLVVKGFLSPNKAGFNVGLYWNRSGVLHLIGKGAVQANGSFTAKANLPRGNYLLVVTIGPTPGNRSGAALFSDYRR